MEPDLENLVEDLKELFSQKQSFINPLSLNDEEADDNATNFQSPIKGNWYSSGGFAPGSPSPGHPSGHMGLDMRASGGTPIYPLNSGVVTFVGSDARGGNFVKVQHANGIRSYYAHMSTVSVHKGDKVNHNTVLGTVGNTGNARHTFPHLHLQVWKNEQLQDPAIYFPIRTGKFDPSKEATWISDEAKQNAQSFNMKEHLNNRRIAFSKDVNKLIKIADLYSRLAVTNNGSI